MFYANKGGDFVKKTRVLLTTALAGILCSQTVFAATFSDVPQTHWAYTEVTRANVLGLVSGMGDGIFGLGQTVTRGQFVSMLCRMFGWEMSNTQTGSFSDNQQPEQWYFAGVETAVQHGAIDTNTDTFRPNDPITREEMAVMIIKGLGYDNLVEIAEQIGSPFTDVTANKGYINLAYDFGIVSGKGNGQFAPDGTATREEAAAMLLRCYDKLHQNTDFVHGFYAFSSYSQKELAKQMDTVSFGWSKLEYRTGEGVVVNTLSDNQNEWVVPEGYDSVVNELQNSGVKTNLNVFLSDTATANTILSDATNRSAAVQAIVEEATITYQTLGRSPYTGVTIDFEGLRGSQMKADFTAFLQELDTALTTAGRQLYVVVHPALSDGQYYDGYDYKAIGEIADKVILMAYDYEAKAISEQEQQNGFTTTPVTPFDQIYYGLHMITDPTTGIADSSKVVLGLSPASNVEWDLQDGVIVNRQGIDNDYSTITQYIQNGGVVTYSEKYRNPSLTIQDGNVTHVIWYENTQSLRDKIQLAQMFDITGVSVWRLGLIPDSMIQQNAKYGIF